MKKLLMLIFTFILIPLSACSSSETQLLINLSPRIAWQGKTIFFQIKSAEKLKSARCLFLNQNVECYPQGNIFAGALGIPVDQAPDLYRMHFKIIKADGTTAGIDRIVKVWKTNFQTRSFKISAAKKGLYAPEILKPEWSEVEEFLKIESPEKMWQSGFLWPVNEIISMPFGTREYVNGRKRGQHRGTDFKAKIGTPVSAPNSGKVVFAKNLKAFGGTLIIDHGQGMHTLYFHLSKFLATTGQLIKKGQIIAETGNSGISSGPHLHWGMSVHNLRVDPMQWVKGATNFVENN